MENIKTLEELNNYILDNVPFIIDRLPFGYVGIKWMKEYEIKSIDMSFIVGDKYDLIDEIDKKYFKFYEKYISEEKLISEVLQLINENKEVIVNINSKRNELYLMRSEMLFKHQSFTLFNKYIKEDIYFNVIDNYFRDIVISKGSIPIKPLVFGSCLEYIFNLYYINEELIFVKENDTFFINYDKFIKDLSKFLKLKTIDTISVFINYIKSHTIFNCDIEFVENTSKFKDYDYYFSDEYKKYHNIINLLHNCDKNENAYTIKYSKNNNLLCSIEKERIIISHDKFIKNIAKEMKIDIVSAMSLIKEYFKEVHKTDNDNFIIVDNCDKFNNYIIDNEELIENILNYDKKMSIQGYFDNIISKATKDINENDETKPIDNKIEINKKTEIIDHDLSCCLIDTSIYKSDIIYKSKNEILLENRISELEKQIDANNELLDTILNKISL